MLLLSIFFGLSILSHIVLFALCQIARINDDDEQILALRQLA